MICKTVEYEDFDGNKRKEDFHFHFTKAEIVEMELSEQGGLEKKIKAIISAQDTKELIKLFKEVVLKAYGVKSPDGKRMIKNDEIREEFQQTEAYSQIFMELVTDTDAAIKFINGVIPSDVAEKVAEEMKNNPSLADFSQV